MYLLVKKMWLSLLLGLSLSAPYNAAAATKVGRWSETTNKRWWSSHTTPSDWITEKPAIHDQLTAIYKKLGTQKALENKHFTGWASHLLWLSLFPENYQEDDYFDAPEAQQVFRQIALDQPAQQLFLLNLSPHDNQLNALKIFCKLYQTHPQEMKDYASLAVAFSIVFDQPFPEGWPHAFVNNDPRPSVSFINGLNTYLMLDQSFRVHHWL